MENYLGEIKPFAGDFAPVGWAFCDGRLLPIEGNNTLFYLIGTKFGGDGVTNFALPNLCSRVAIGQSDSYPLATVGGQEQVTLTVQQLPAHSHPVYASSSNKPDGDGPQNNFWASPPNVFSYAVQPGNTAMNTKSVTAAGLGFPHENRVPFVAISYIIALTGVYPTPA